MVSSVTPHPGMDPQPRVEVLVDPFDLNGSTATITVWQTSELGEVRVRDAIRKTVAGGFTVEDFEVPTGVTVTYRVQQFNTAGVDLGFALEMQTQVDIPDGMVVLSDPLNPARAVMVDGHADFAGELRRSRPVRTINAGGNTVALMGLQGLLDSVPLVCNTRSLEDADMLDLILQETQVLVRLMPSGGRLPIVFQCVVPDPVQVPQDVQWGGEWVRWDLGGHQVSRTELDIIVPLFTWQDVIDYYPTWTALMAAHVSWLDLLRNPPEV